MTKSTRSSKKRLKVKSLPAKAKTLTAKEAKKVKGGLALENTLVTSYLKPPKPPSTV